MKLLASLAAAAALASAARAAARDSTAPLFLLRSSSSSAAPVREHVPQLPKELVRPILLQRLGADGAVALLDSLPSAADDGLVPEAALQWLHQFGVRTPGVLDDDGAASAAPRRPQMLVVVEGVVRAHVAALEAALPAAFAVPALAVANPPSAAANARLFVDELGRAGIQAAASKLADALATRAPDAWDRGVYLGLYDVKKDPSVVDDLVAALPQILSLVERGDAEAAILLLPEAQRYAKSNTWASAAQNKIRPSAPALELRNADAESVIAADEPAPAAHEFFASSSSAPAVPAVPAGPIPACFQSFNSCIAQTGNCSQHGTCVDKYAANGGGLAAAAAPGGSSCFVCHCFSTLNRPESDPGGLSTTHWAGNMCQKKDVSVPFWLLAGFTVTLVGAVSFAIGLLFSVGEEKLPGVIGAGVSRTK